MSSPSAFPPSSSPFFQSNLALAHPQHLPPSNVHQFPQLREQQQMYYHYQMQPQPPHHPYPQAYQSHQPLHRFATPFNPHSQQAPAQHHGQLTSFNVQGLPSSSTQHPPSLLQPSVHQQQLPQQQPSQQQPQRRRLDDHQQHLLAAACLGRTSQGDVKLSPLFNTYAEEDREAISAHLLGEKAHRRHAQQQEDERLRSLPQPVRKAVPVVQKSRQRKQQPQKPPRSSSSSSKGGQEDVEDAVVGIARPAPLLSPPLSDRSDSSSSSSSSHTIRGSDKMVVVEENRCSSSLTSNLTTPPVEPRTLVVAVNKLQGAPARSSSETKGADVAVADPRKNGEEMRRRLETEYQTQQVVPLPSSLRAQPVVVATPLKHVTFNDTVLTKTSSAAQKSPAANASSSSTLPSVPTRLSSTKRAHSEVDSSQHTAPAAKRLATSSSSSGWVPPPSIPHSLTYFDLAAYYRKLDAWENEHNPELYVAW